MNRDEQTFGRVWPRLQRLGRNLLSWRTNTTDNKPVIGFVSTTFFVPFFGESSGLTEKEIEKRILKAVKEQIRHKGGKSGKSKKTNS